MLILLVDLFIFGYGLWYAINPIPSLKRKFREDEVPREAIRTAHIVGGVIAAVGLVCAVYTVADLLRA
ncbi:MAG: hypothetical protein ACI4OU_03295 [Candidatus Enterenecus sp.]